MLTHAYTLHGEASDGADEAFLYVFQHRGRLTMEVAQQELAEQSLPSADGPLCVGTASTTSPPCGGGTRRRAAVVRSSELARSLAVYAAEVGEEVAA
jgi:hypothetical protein